MTGTTSGIGLSVARLLLSQGWFVVGMARRPAAIDHAGYRHVASNLRDLAGTVRWAEHELAPLLADNRWQRMGLVNNAASADLLVALEQIDPAALLALYAVNVAAPIFLMGFVLRHCPRGASLRIVNVSSGAAVSAFPGLAAYRSSKAALRMAGMVFGAELAQPERRLPASDDVAILSYEPGTVDTPMQELARSLPDETFPSAALFHHFRSQGILVQPEAPSGEIVAFLESSGQPQFTERRFGT